MAKKWLQLSSAIPPDYLSQSLAIAECYPITIDIDISIDITP